MLSLCSHLVTMYWVRRRGLTRAIFACRVGKSVSWVDKIRNGDRQLDRLSVLRQIAQVLDIPLEVLIDPEEAERRRSCPDEREIAAIRAALRRYDAITNVFRPNDEVLPAPNLTQLERRVRYGWMAFQASNYRAIGQLLPDLIREARRGRLPAASTTPRIEDLATVSVGESTEGNRGSVG